MTKKIAHFLYPWAFFCASLLCSTYNIDFYKRLFRGSFTNSCHFELYSSRIRPFPAILSKFEKWLFFAQKSMLFSQKSEKKRQNNWLQFYQTLKKTFKNIRNNKSKIFLGKFLFLDSLIIFICQSKHKKIWFLRKKHRFFSSKWSFFKFWLNGRKLSYPAAI